MLSTQSAYKSMRYTNRLAGADLTPSVGTQGDAFDNALAESVIGLYKTEESEHLSHSVLPPSTVATPPLSRSNQTA